MSFKAVFCTLKIILFRNCSSTQALVFYIAVRLSQLLRFLISCISTYIVKIGKLFQRRQGYIKDEIGLNNSCLLLNPALREYFSQLTTLGYPNTMSLECLKDFFGFPFMDNLVFNYIGGQAGRDYMDCVIALANASCPMLPA